MMPTTNLNRLAGLIGTAAVKNPRLAGSPAPVIRETAAIALEHLIEILSNDCGPMSLRALVEDDFGFCEMGGIAERLNHDDDGALCVACANEDAPHEIADPRLPNTFHDVEVPSRKPGDPRLVRLVLRDARVGDGGHAMLVLEDVGQVDALIARLLNAKDEVWGVR